MDIYVQLIFIFAAFGFVAFIICAIRFLNYLLTSDKRRAEYDQQKRQRAEAEDSFKRLLEESKDKDMRIKELEEIVSVLQNSIARFKAASAPLPSRFYGGELAYDYRDVDIYVPDGGFDKLVLGNPLFVARSKNNRYDKDAVSLNYSGEEFALLCRGKIQEMALDYIDRGDAGYAIVSFIDAESKTAKVHLGFYKDCDLGNDDDEFDFNDGE